MMAQPLGRVYKLTKAHNIAQLHYNNVTGAPPKAGI